MLRKTVDANYRKAISLLETSSCQIALRNSRGSVILLFLSVAFMITILFVFSCRVAHFLIEKQRYQQAIEAAALRAATELSEIVVNDPYWGFISLSDQRPVGYTTIAGDGEPLPIHGINTIIATTRLDYIIAQETNDTNLAELALEDIRHAREASIRLNRVLERSLKPTGNNSTDVAHDMDGAEVHPYADALEVYKLSIKSFTSAAPESFQLSLGWLRTGGATITSIPFSNTARTLISNKLSSLPEGTACNGCYRSYVDVPVGQQHFAFTSLAKEPTLVKPNDFVPKYSKGTNTGDCNKDPADFDPSSLTPEQNNKYLSSIVRAEANWRISHLFDWDMGKSIESQTISGCAQPYAIPNSPTPSIFVMAFPNGRPQGINSMADILGNPGLCAANMNMYSTIQGDFPVDSQAYLQPLTESDRQKKASAAFAQAFFDWLRSNYALPKVDAVMTALNQTLSDNCLSSAGTSSIFVAEITEVGSVALSKLSLNPFEDIRINENQLYAINSSPALIGGMNWTVVCRDQVHNMGTIAGGKHGGQPMPGDPVNWSELRTYVNDSFAATVINRKPNGVTLMGQQLPGGAISLLGSQLLCNDGKALPRTLRKSAYSGGLGVEVRISSPLAAY